MRRFGSPRLLLSLLAICTLLLAACGGGSTTGGSSNSGGGSSTSNVKTVALVTDIGGLNDQGFNELSNTGYQKARTQYGFQQTVIETQSEADYVKNLTQASQAADLVIGVGFLMATAMDQVAKANPSKHYALIDSCAQLANGNCDNLPNVAPLYFTEEQAGCLVGAAAGQMENDGKSKVPNLLGANTIGAVGGISIPSVNRYIAGYQFCAKKVDPSIKVIINYSQSFTDTAKCSDVANSQINQDKADIIFQVAGGCGIGALQAAHSKNVYGIGVDSNQNGINSSVITSAMKRVDTAVYDTIVNFETGKFTNNPPRFDLKSGGVGNAPFTSAVPQDAQTLSAQYASQIKSGALVVPQDIQK
jgi:basic membrane protein A and related proteins